MFVAELVVLASVKYHWHYVEVRSFTCTLNEYCTRVFSSVLMSVFTQKNHCIWVVNSVLDICALGGAAPWLTDVADFFNNNHWQGDCDHLSSMVVQKPWTTCNSVWNCIQDWGQHYLNCFIGKAKNHVTEPFLYCWKHIIQSAPTFLHLPSQVGNAYDCLYFGTKGALKNCLFFPVVTVATLCWWFGNRQGDMSQGCSLGLLANTVPMNSTLSPSFCTVKRMYIRNWIFLSEKHNIPDIYLPSISYRN